MLICLTKFILFIYRRKSNTLDGWLTKKKKID